MFFIGLKTNLNEVVKLKILRKYIELESKCQNYYYVKRMWE